MNLQYYQYFITIAEELNFTRAAKRLFVSQQALSGAILRMEEAYGVTLFQRKPFLRLTPAGEMMLAYAKKVVEGEKTLKQRIQLYNHEICPHIHMAATTRVVTQFIPDIWDDFLEIYPNAMLSMIDNTIENSCALIKANKLDLFFSITDSGRLPDTSVDIMDTNKFYLVADQSLIRKFYPDNWRQFILNNTDSAHLQDFSLLPFSLPSANNSFHKKIDPIFEQEQVDPIIVFHTSDQRLVYRMCMQGRFVGVLSEIYLHYLMHEYPISDGLCLFPFPNELNADKLRISYSADTAEPDVIKNFIRCTRNVLEIQQNNADHYFSKFLMLQKQRYDSQATVIPDQKNSATTLQKCMK